MLSRSYSPWYNHTGRLGVKYQLTYLLSRSYTKKTGKMRPFSEAMRPLVSTFILFALMVGWAALSPIDIVEKQARLFYWTTGTAFSNIAVGFLYFVTFCSIPNLESNQTEEQTFKSRLGKCDFGCPKMRNLLCVGVLVCMQADVCACLHPCAFLTWLAQHHVCEQLAAFSITVQYW